MKKNSFIAYSDRIDYMDDMPMEQRGILFTAILNYTNGLEVGDLGEVKYVWNKIRKEIDANTEKYEEICNQRSEAGRIGGKKHKGNQYTQGDTKREAQKNTVEANGSNGNKWKQMEHDSDSEYDNNTENNKLSPNGDNSEAEFGKKEINDLIGELKEQCNHLGIAYEKTKEREFAKHILTAKDYGEFAEKIGQDRVQFAKNIITASCQLKYKFICAGPKSIYQHYAEIYNEFMKNKPKIRQIVLDDL